MKQAVRLRAPEPEDVERMFEADNDRTAWFASDMTAPLSRQQLRDYVAAYDGDPWRDGQLRLIAEDSATGCPVGIADFYELDARHGRGFAGVYILRSCRKKGYGKAMLEAMCVYAHRYLMLSQLAARIPADNATSLHLFQNVGFSHSGTLRAWHRAAGEVHDIAIYQLLFDK